MNYARIILVIFLIAVATALIAVAVRMANQTATNEPSSDQLVVGTTIFPLADITQRIGGDHVYALLVIPPGTSEHSTALSPEQLQQLQHARILFQIGHGLDDQVVNRITAAVPSVRPVPVDAGIALHEFRLTEEGHEEEKEEHADEASEDEHEHDTGTDPHYWLTVPNGIQIARTIAATLQDIDPTHTQDYQKNLAQYEDELQTLEQELQAAARALPRKEFIATHNAWSYFAEHYGLRLVATYEPVEGREPSLGDLQELREVIGRYGITTFFAEPQKLSSATTAFIEREFGLQIGTLDPVGGLPDTDSYLKLMGANMAALAN